MAATYNKILYNEGSKITKAPAAGGNPVWSTKFSGTPVTDTHVPCGYWFKDYTAPPTVVTSLDGNLLIFYVDGDGAYQAAACNVGLDGAITVTSAKSFDEIGISGYEDAHPLHFMIKSFTHKVKDLGTGVEIERTLYFISTDFWLSEATSLLVYDPDDPFSWLSGSTVSALNWYILDPLLSRIYLIGYYPAPFSWEDFNQFPSPELEASINFSVDNSYFYVAGLTLDVWENAYKNVYCYSLLNNSLDTVSSGIQQAGFSNIQRWDCFIGQDGLLTGAPTDDWSIEFTTDVVSKSGYYSYNFVKCDPESSGYVSTYKHAIISKDLGSPMILNDIMNTPYYTTSFGDSIPVVQEGLLTYGYLKPWTMIDTTDLYVQSFCIEEYYYNGGGSYDAIKRMYKDETSWLSTVMAAVGVVSEEKLLGISYIPTV